MKTTSYYLLQLFFIFIFYLLPIKLFAYNYIVSFSGTGASLTVGDVIVQNLTKGTSVIVPAGNVLNLSDTPNGIEQLKAFDENIRIYNNSLDGNSIMSFDAKQAGYTTINAFSIDGRKIAGSSFNLEEGSNSFQISLSRGIFIVQVIGKGYLYSAKFINRSNNQNSPEILYRGNLKNTNTNIQKIKSAAGVTSMYYATGDRLIYKGTSGNYSKAVVDIPNISKIVTFDFVDCTDNISNHYTTVKIGSQTWMIENLKTTKYRNNDNITNVTDASWNFVFTGAYCVYNNDTTYTNKYGLLYNWYAVNDLRNIAPIGWHVPSDSEWSILQNYLLSNGYIYDGSTLDNNIAKSIAATTNWNSYTGGVAVGNNLKKNNASGFSALPSGCRSDYSYFYDVGDKAYWWSLSEYDNTSAYYRRIEEYLPNIYRDSNIKTRGYAIRCVSDNISKINTTSVSGITDNSAYSGGYIFSDGGSTISARGVCWSTTPLPTISLSTKTLQTDTTRLFSSLITGLTSGTKYYVRAYYTNSLGTFYGNEECFNTLGIATASDIDGNVYHTVKIGDQTWMVENLKTTKYRNGESITYLNNVTPTTWMNATFGAWCNYEVYQSPSLTLANGVLYGHLYNWYALNDSRQIAPLGWHIPTDAEWTILENYLIANGYNYDGTTTGDRDTNNKIAKSLAATTKWATDTSIGTIGNDLTKNNSSGFSALPGGLRNYAGDFCCSGTFGIWWSSTLNGTNIICRNMGSDKNKMIKNSFEKYCGISVRCIKD